MSIAARQATTARIAPNNGVVSYAGASGPTTIRFTLSQELGPVVDLTQCALETEVDITASANYADAIISDIGTYGLLSCIERITVRSGGTVIEEVNDFDRLLHVRAHEIDPEELESYSAAAGGNKSFSTFNKGTVSGGALVDQQQYADASAFAIRNQTKDSTQRTTRVRAHLTLAKGIFSVRSWPIAYAPLEVVLHMKRAPRLSNYPGGVEFEAIDMTGAPAAVITTQFSHTHNQDESPTGNAGERDEYASKQLYDQAPVIIYGVTNAGATYIYRRVVTDIAANGGANRKADITLNANLGGQNWAYLVAFPAIDAIGNVQYNNPYLHVGLPAYNEKKVEMMAKALSNGMEMTVHSYRAYRRNIGSTLSSSVPVELGENDCKALLAVMYSPHFLSTATEGNNIQLTNGVGSGRNVESYVWDLDGMTWPDREVDVRNRHCGVHSAVLLRALEAGGESLKRFEARSLIAPRAIEWDGEFAMGAPANPAIKGGEELMMIVEKYFEDHPTSGKTYRLQIERSADTSRATAQVTIYALHSRTFMLNQRGVISVIA